MTIAPEKLRELALAGLGKLGAEASVALQLREALEGETKNAFHVDASWRPHHHGPPRQDPGREGFGEPHLWAGACGLAYLTAMLPVGDSLRATLPSFYQTVAARLAHPELIFDGGFASNDDALLERLGDPSSAVVKESTELPQSMQVALFYAHRYPYFRPTERPEHNAAAHDELLRCCWPAWAKGQWTSPYRAYLTFRYRLPALMERLQATPLAAGQHEADPRASAPDVVEAVRQRHDLGELAATLYLQLATLADCSDRWLQAVDGSSRGEHQSALGELLARRLVVDDKRPRAGRKATLPGTWLTLAAPQPGLEEHKLALYEAIQANTIVAAPLGRIVPLRPWHELFAQAWAHLAAQEGGGVRAAVGAAAPDWLEAIRQAPDDDEPRRVYADWLIERGDARGELISVQCDLAALPPQAPERAPLAAREATLLESVGAEVASPIQAHVEAYRFDRGFIVGITVRPQVLVKRASLFVEALPLLDSVQLTYRGGVGRIPDKALDALADCLLLGRLRRLDFGPNHFPGAHAFARLLKNAPLDRLEVLRIGYNRKGSGVGKIGMRALLASPALPHLKEVGLPGQRLGPSGGLVLLLEAAGTPLANLEVLDLAYNELEKEHAEALLAAIEDNKLPKLRTLQLENRLEDEALPNWMLEPSRNRLDEALLARLRKAVEAAAGDR